MESCSHLEQVNADTEANTKGCEECEKTSDEEFHPQLDILCIYKLKRGYNDYEQSIL
jgi:hypothetical protein